MVDFTAIAAAASSFKTIQGILKNWKDISDKSQMQAMVAELNSAIITAQNDTMAAQAEQFGLVEKVKELEAQLAEVESWDHVLDCYELVDFGAQTFAYQLKQSADDGEPMHLICPKCVANKKKSLLQFDCMTEVVAGFRASS